MLDKLIKDMTEKGIAAIGYIKFRGEADACFKFIQLMADTRLYKPDTEEWNYIAVRMARDGGSSN